MIVTANIRRRPGVIVYQVELKFSEAQRHNAEQYICIYRQVVVNQDRTLRSDGSVCGSFDA